MNATANAENRLGREKSPYLLQHADDPVHWYPWGEEAFFSAAREDKPIFLSIGYSTCHWCHVMGRESFRDPEVAKVLNRSFVSIKVDREERPDVDAVYMDACQALTGSGGWPLTILMTPDQKPFWAGTYLPPRGREGRGGLVELLEEVERLWRGGRSGLLDLGQRVADHLTREEPARSSRRPSRALLDAAARQLEEEFDPEHGGFGGAPKFPSPQKLLFLLDRARREGEAGALAMAGHTLTQMARGGIFDQVGGGFCRYSTDRGWRMPHFEKMLNDNALLACAYLEAYAQTGKPYYRETACRTLDYVLEELRLPGGGFACAQDADSGGEEGRYYLWTKEEICAVLGDQDGERFCTWYAIPSQGRWLPHLLYEPQYDQAWRRLSGQCRALAQARRTRGLHRDDKVLTSANALMIAALARAYRVLGDARYLRAAESARLFLKTRLMDPDGRLYLRWRDGEAAVPGQLEDYAFTCWALLELYEADFSVHCLKSAVKLADAMAERFWDEARGGFYRVGAGGEVLLVRQKEVYEGAHPSGNAVAALALVRLAKLTAEERLRTLADRQLAYLSGAAAEYPAGCCFGLLAVAEDLSPRPDLLCAAREVPAWLAGACEEYRLSALAKTEENARSLAAWAPFTQPYPVPPEGMALHLCRDGACLAPVGSLEELRRGLLGSPVETR